MQFSIQEVASAGSGLSRDAQLLLNRWNAAEQEAGALPAAHVFPLEDLWCLNDTLMVCLTESGTFRYLHYGVRIAGVTGFDMTGAETKDFGSRTGQFFTEGYHRCLDERRPLVATNPAAHVALVTGWRRLMLPLCDDTGRATLVLTHLQPLGFRHHLLSSVLDATTDAIIGLNVGPSADSAADPTVTLVNRAAQELIGANQHQIIGKALAEVLPGWSGSEPAQALVDSLDEKRSRHLQWHAKQALTPAWFQVAIEPLKDGGAVITLTDISDAKQRESRLLEANETLDRLVRVDSLTGVASRRHFLAVAEREFNRARASSLPLSCLVVDVDRLKTINDSFGHAAGDAVLQSIAQRMQNALRRQDLVGRLGGDEFGVLLPGARLEHAVKLARQIRDLVRHTPIPRAEDDRTVPIRGSCSIGVAALTEDVADFAALLDRADRQLYDAKHAGRGKVHAQPADS